MLLSPSFTCLRSNSILVEDDDWIVVNKPAGVSVDAGDARSQDDLISRVRARLGERDGTGLSVRIRAPWHLERDTSGIVPLIRAPRSRASGLSPGSRFVWLVGGVAGQRLREEGTVQTRVVKDRDGRTRLARYNERGARTVRATYRVVKRGGNRVLLEADTEEYGSRGIRTALAGLGVLDIAGEGGIEAPRLLIHLLRARLIHPVVGQSVEVACGEPWVFDAWVQGHQGVDGLSAEALRDACHEAIVVRHGLAMRGDVQALRWIHGEAEGLRGLDIEQYGDHLVIWLGEQVSDATKDNVLAVARDFGAKGSYLKIRPRQASKIVNAKSAGLVSEVPAWGDIAAPDLAIGEGAIRMRVRLSEGLSTGLFLDQRGAREWVRSVAAGKRVLNLFAYTCGFTVAAAVGGAIGTVSVDASAALLARGRANLEANGIDGERHELVCDDVRSWLRNAAAQGREFDLVVLDPPSYSTTRGGRFVAARDYVDVAAACIDRVAEGGVLVACTNLRSVDEKHFVGWLREAGRRAGRTIGRATVFGPEPDFPVLPGTGPHLKAVRCEVGGRKSGPTRATQR